MAGHFHTVLLDLYVGDVFSGLEALPFIGAKIGIIFHITACFGELFMESSSDTPDNLATVLQVRIPSAAMIFSLQI